MSGNDDEERFGPVRRYTRRLGRSASALSIPYIMIGYPLTGYFLGWFLMKTFNWPSWVPILTIVMAMVQAFREIFKIAKRCEENDTSE